MARPRRRDIVVVAASAGGVEALRALVHALPAPLHAAILVVLHTTPDVKTMLPTILARSGPLPAQEVVDGEPVRHGRVYVARSNHHLLVERDRIRVLVGPHENGLRPAADPLFRSAAHAFGDRVMGVVLSGTRDDGTAGLRTIKEHGGLTVVQDPEEAIFTGMPESALAMVRVDYCLPVVGIARLIIDCSRVPAVRGGTPDRSSNGADADQGGPHHMADTTAGAGQADGERTSASQRRVAEGQDQVAPVAVDKQEGHASGLTCPECRGSLWEAREGDNLWFECRVSHRFSFQSMLAEQARTVEASIWAAINVLEERAALLRKRSVYADDRGNRTLAHRFGVQASEAEEHAQAIRTQLLGMVQSFGGTGS